MQKTRDMTQSWQPHSWRSHEARQLPTYKDDAALAAVRGGTPELRRRHQLDRLRLLSLGGSVLAMTALVFAVVAGAPPLVVLVLQGSAIFGVALGVIASFWR